MRIAFGAALAWLLLAAALRAEPRLLLPIACDLGRDCWLQQFVDHQPGDGAQDFLCGSATYDDHKGTDVRVSAADYARGVTVRAPAAGVVRALRDGMPDRLARTPADRAALAGRDCGNGVVIDHGDGWESQLCHMARGSLLVRKGQRVEAGAPLGRVGLSGNTQFRHVHLSLRHRGRVVDPFAPELAPGSCGGVSGSGLWADPAVAEAARQPSRVLAAGAAGGPLSMEAAVEGAGGAALSGQAPIVLWGVAINPRAGDRFQMILEGPGGRVLFETLAPPQEKPQAQALRYAGRRPPPGGWPPGAYRWQVVLLRGAAVLDRRAGSFTLE